MGFFVRSKKARKDSPASDPIGHGQAALQRRRPPPPAPTQVSQNRHPSGSRRQPPPFQPAGLLPPPPGWNGEPQPPTGYHPSPYPPIIVNQHHYYLGVPPAPQSATRRYTTSTPVAKRNPGSSVKAAKEVYQGSHRLLGGSEPVSHGNALVNAVSHQLNNLLASGAISRWHHCESQLANHGSALADEISSRFDNILTMIDQGCCNGKEYDILAWQPAQAVTPPPPAPGAAGTEKSPLKGSRKSHKKGHPKGQTTAAAAVVSRGFFAKVELYANSRLPMNLPPLKLYIPTYPLLCLAAQYAERVYEPPSGRAERDAQVDADWRTGTKAMVIKSVPMDYMNTIVFAIRGTASFMDWAVNLNMAPKSPAGFLDDPGNLCHAGFLSVARNMVSPVARRLRELLEEDPRRACYSLLITGHSAGGAVAALLYSHMLATSKAAESELNAVAGCFKRIHCITFGTPPVSLMPLTTPDDYTRRPRLRKSLFLSFVNEGDPVTRADKAYVKSLLELFRATPPRVETHQPNPTNTAAAKGSRKPRRSDKPAGKASSKSSTISTTSASTATKTSAVAGPVWKVPPCALSCAGRIVVLRSGDPKARLRGKKTTVEERLHEGVVAQVVTDEQLRGVIWGDPVAHMMRLYAGRIEVLAVGAVTGQGL